MTRPSFAPYAAVGPHAALAALAAAALLVALPARAQFEGRLDYTLVGTPGAMQGGGSATTYLSAAGARSEMTLSTTAPGGGAAKPTRMVSLYRTAEPGKTWLLDDAQKTYMVVTAEPGAGDDFKVERLGAAKVNGRGCEKARITSARSGTRQEMCVTKELGRLPFLAAMSGRGGADLPAALRKAGLDGVPVQWQTFAADGKVAFTMDLVAAKKQRVPASLLAVPAGYKESSLGGLLASPEQAKQMEAAMKQMQERMKDMTPEQRKQLEEIMKQMGAGKK